MPCKGRIEVLLGGNEALQFSAAVDIFSEKRKPKLLVLSSLNKVKVKKDAPSVKVVV